jgi:KUP system potassium uptake protein
MPTHIAQPLRAGLVVGALGVVFGDIGTSPIYTVQTLFNPADPHPVPISIANVYGVVSLIFWSVMLIVTLTYVMLVMRADNDGEGGVVSLITLVRRFGGRSDRRVIGALSTLGILGAALFFGDSMITPAISVLSAVEGMKIVDPELADFVVPITAVIIVGLFAVERRGTATVGRLFGPVMVVWFVVIGILGVRGIVGHPQILRPSRRSMRWNSWPTTSTSRSSHWPRWSSRSPGLRRSTPTWATSAGRRSRWPGWGWCCRRWC